MLLEKSAWFLPKLCPVSVLNGLNRALNQSYSPHIIFCFEWNRVTGFGLHLGGPYIFAFLAKATIPLVLNYWTVSYELKLTKIYVINWCLLFPILQINHWFTINGKLTSLYKATQIDYWFILIWHFDAQKCLQMPKFKIKQAENIWNKKWQTNKNLRVLAQTGYSWPNLS